MNEMMMNATEEKELFIRYGSAASEAMFDFPCDFFRLPDSTGIIAYRKEFQCAIVIGDPICPPEETKKLTKAFHEFCKESHLNIIYIIVSEKFAKLAENYGCKISIEVCEEFVFDPANDPSLQSNRLRHRVEKAKKHGLTVHEYLPHDAEIEKSLTEIGREWQRAIKGPNVYLGHLNFFEDYSGKRWFYVKDGEKITSMIMLSKIEAADGWLLKFMINSPEAIHDTSEFLVTSVLEILRNENCHFLTKGMMPSNVLGHVKGLSSPSTWIIKNIYQGISWFYKFKKRKDYWLRYFPKALPSYLVLSNSHIGLNEARALMNVFKTSHGFNNKRSF